MFPLLGIILLGFAFLILVVTFIWVANLLAVRARQKSASEPAESQEKAAEPEPEEELVEEELEEVEEEEPEEVPEENTLARGRGYGANYGLLLGVLACGFFWVSPLLMALSFVGVFYSGRALWLGVRYFRAVTFRALIGMVLCVGSMVLHYLKAIGELPAILL